MTKLKSAARPGENITKLSGATREFAGQGADFAGHAADQTRATAEEIAEAASEVYATFTSSTLNFHHQWIELVRANTNATLDFVHQIFDVKSPSQFVELSAEHVRKRVETFAEQARQLTGMAQKLTADAAGPMRASMKNALNNVA